MAGAYAVRIFFLRTCPSQGLFIRRACFYGSKDSTPAGLPCRAACERNATARVYLAVGFHSYRPAERTRWPRSRATHGINNGSTRARAAPIGYDAPGRVRFPGCPGTCDSSLPEPQVEIRDQAMAKAKERHQKILKMAALNMQGDARADLMELIERAN